MIKDTCRFRRAGNEKSGTYVTLNAVGRAVPAFKSIAAFVLGNKSCRAAAVKVKSIHAAKSEHGFGKLTKRLTDRGRELSAVNNKHDNGAVRLDTDCTSGHKVSVSSICGNLSVFNQNNGAADALFEVCFGISLCGSSSDFGLSVLTDCEIRPVFVRSVKCIVHYKCSGRSTGLHVVIVTVGAGNNINTEFFLGGSSLLSYSLQAP